MQQGKNAPSLTMTLVQRWQAHKMGVEAQEWLVASVSESSVHCPTLEVLVGRTKKAKEITANAMRNPTNTSLETPRAKQAQPKLRKKVKQDAANLEATGQCLTCSNKCCTEQQATKGQGPLTTTNLLGKN
jgi:hypothetical protein